MVKLTSMPAPTTLNGELSSYMKIFLKNNTRNILAIVMFSSSPIHIQIFLSIAEYGYMEMGLPYELMVMCFIRIILIEMYRVCLFALQILEFF